MIPWPDLTWQPIDKPLEQRIQEVLASWERTPYMKGQMVRGRGVDCVRFVAAALDELYGTGRRDIPNLPQDASWHNTRLVVTAVKELVRIYGPVDILRDGEPVEPGDILVTAPSEAGGPGHVLMAGGVRGQLWHAMPRDGVRFTGLQVFGQRLLRIYRICDRAEWVAGSCSASC